MEDGSDAVRGRMSGLRAGCPGSGSVDELDEHRVERSNPGQNSEDFVDGNWGKDGEKLDLPATHEISGSNPTKLHHTNKSQKKLGLFLWGNFWIRTKNNKIKLENKERGLRNRDQRGSWYQDDVGRNPRWPIFHERSGSLRGT